METSLQAISFKTHLYCSFALRIALIFYGEYQDSRLLVKFTDVDYRVFTDAARHVHHGQSPYDRHTYRYTPLLAWLMYPNVTVSPLFGKFTFCIMDIAVGYLIYAFVKDFYRTWPKVELQARICAFVWLYNPLVFVVSARYVSF